MFYSELKTVVTETKSEIIDVANGLEYNKKKKKRKRAEFFRDRWEISTELIRAWTDKADKIRPFIEAVMSQKEIEIGIPKSPKMNRIMLENLANLGEIVIYCCPSYGFEINNNGLPTYNYQGLDDIHGDLGVAGNMIRATLAQIKPALEELQKVNGKIPAIKIIMPEYEFERVGSITTDQQPPEEEVAQRDEFRSKLQSTAEKLKSELADQQETRNLEVEVKVSSEIYQDDEVIEFRNQIRTFVDEAVEKNPKLKAKIYELQNNPVYSDRDVLNMIAEQVFITREADPNSSIILNTEEKGVAMMVQEIIEEMLKDQDAVGFFEEKGMPLPMLIVQKGRFYVAKQDDKIQQIYESRQNNQS